MNHTSSTLLHFFTHFFALPNLSNLHFYFPKPTCLVFNVCKFLGLSSSSFAASSLIIKALLKNFLKYYIPYLFCPSSFFAVEILNSVSNMSLKWLQGFQLRSVSRACLCNTMQISSFNSVSINYAFPQ